MDEPLPDPTPAAEMDEPLPEQEQNPAAQLKKPKRKRNPSLKVWEQQEAEKMYQQHRKRATTFDENSDIDDPTILQVSIFASKFNLHLIQPF